MNKKIVTLLLIVGGLFLGSVASADYCSVAFFNGANFSNSIRRVLLTGNNFTLDKETSAEAGFSLFPHYNHYTTGTTLSGGETYDITIQVGFNVQQRIGLWIDYNGNETFEESERIGSAANAPDGDSLVKIEFTVPTEGVTGVTRMRVIDETDVTSVDPCVSQLGAYLNGEAEDYDITLVGLTPVVAVALTGGGARRVIPVDFCPEGDMSMTPYDGLCVGMSPIDGIVATGTVPPHTAVVVTNTGGSATGASTADSGTMNNNTGTTTPEVVPLPRVDTDRCADAEMETAFVFAHENGLTTTETCMSARMTDSLTRGEAAKIISNFAMNILDKTPDSSMKCVFSDMIDADSETRTYAKTACQLGLMGLKGDGTPAETFSPNEIVTKAQITTILSRLLWGDENNTIDACRYCQHVKALKEASVINVTTDLMIPLQRGYAMLMIMRIKQ